MHFPDPKHKKSAVRGAVETQYPATNTLDIPIPVKLAGRYRLTATHSETGVERELTGWFDNLITFGGLDYLMTSPNALNYCMVGTGTTPPVQANGTLEAQLAFTTNVVASSFASNPTAPYWNSTTRTYQFAVGTVTGLLTEVGVGWNSTQVFSRSLIKDSGGTPTPLEILADEYLNVIYELRQYPPATDSSYTVSLSGTDYTVTRRACNVTQTTYWNIGNTLNSFTLPIAAQVFVYNGSLGAVTGAPSGATSQLSAGATTAWLAAYVAGTRSRTWRLTIPPATGNVASGISAIMLPSPSMGTLQFGFTPAIPKTSSFTLILNFTFVWSA